MITFWDNKPALKICIPFICGILLAAKCTLPIKVAVVVAVIFIVLLCIAFWQKRSRLFLLFTILTFVCIGFVHYQQKNVLPQNNIIYFCDLSCTVSIQGTVSEPVEQDSSRQLFIVKVDSLWALDKKYTVSGKVKMTLCSTFPIVEYGDEIVTRGNLRLPRSERNPGEFDYQKYLAAQGVNALFRASSPDHFIIMQKNTGNVILQKFLYPLRARVTLLIRSHFDSERAGMLIALLIGSRTALDTAIKTAFAETGVFHVLAVSGLHIGFIMALFIGFFSFLRMPQPFRTWLVILLLILYALFTGLKPPVFRATIMAVIYLLGTLLERKANALNSIAVAALIILLMNPNDLFQAGFQLSFSAVLGIVLIYQKLHNAFFEQFRKWRERDNMIAIYFFSLLLVSAAAQITTLPFTIWYFGKIPILSLLANLFVVPIIALILSLAILSILFSTFCFSCGALLFQTVWLLQTLLLKIVNCISGFSFSYIAVSRPSPLLLCAFTLLLCFFIFVSFKQRIIFLSGSFFLLIIFVWMDAFSPHSFLKITFLDVGQGDAVLLQCPNGKNMLIDTGDISDHYCYAEKVIFPFLQRNAVKKLDALVLTHEHSDHIGGAEFLMNNIPVKRIICPPVSFHSELGKKVDSLATLLNIPRQNAQSGDSLFLDDSVLIACLHPNKRFVELVNEGKENVNNSSLVLYCFYCGYSFLFMGDAEQPAEDRIVACFDTLVHSNILKVGHHGSDTAASDLFIDTIQPDIAVISVGKFNRFDLPDASVLEKFQKRNISILRTDQQGAVQFLLFSNKMTRLY